MVNNLFQQEVTFKKPAAINQSISPKRKTFESLSYSHKVSTSFLGSFVILLPFLWPFPIMILLYRITAIRKHLAKTEFILLLWKSTTLAIESWWEKKSQAIRGKVLAMQERGTFLFPASVAGTLLGVLINCTTGPKTVIKLIRPMRGKKGRNKVVILWREVLQKNKLLLLCWHVKEMTFWKKSLYIGDFQDHLCAEFIVNYEKASK